MADSKETPKSDPKEAKPAPTVVELTKTPGSGKKSARRPQARRRMYLAASFVICVLIPGLIGSAYYAFVASDRYVSTAGFSVRSIDGGVSMDGLGALTGLASAGSTTSDSYIILHYLKSRDLVELLEKDVDLTALYQGKGVDPLSRLHPDAPIEDVVQYWDGRISTTFDNTSSMITFEVQAFSPGDADRIAKAILVHVKDLVNDLSESARQDALRFAQGELSRSEDRLRESMTQMRAFREKERSINPAASAQLDIELLGSLQSKLVDIRARISALEGNVDANAPSMQALKRQEDSIQQQIDNYSGGISDDPDGKKMSDLLSEYETLEVDKTFAEKSYASALSSLEQARMDADRQQRYLAVYSQPMVAQQAMYPRRALSVLLILSVLGALWGIGTLIVYAVRDHLT
ncbi:hypothetical protein KM176_03405 [Pseudooceanicola sp. CBS1P-1]|uniref:Lipopolysaccharide biosynthesis protein n=1 Tax=Pseudooceanicola albus TaxID=2692189 RepID=A0A6L7G9A5_9RHOB|nr:MULTISPECIES: lipopolysaccharide biosynthesis protein [Pseudooceanicola]MBT9382899.1 hypothetical protein [Pseudooceanicola endophyticus]MXN20177.1 lipopolysaccharide biosynthesis protein [Pseudooceanicola albus]